jgi:hypothetical protein
MMTSRAIAGSEAPEFDTGARDASPPHVVSENFTPLALTARGIVATIRVTAYRRHRMRNWTFCMGRGTGAFIIAIVVLCLPAAAGQHNREEAAKVRAMISSAPSRTLAIKNIPATASGADAPTTAVATPVPDAQVLKPGQARIRSLSPVLEEQARAVILSNFPEVQNAQASGSSVAVLNGAVEVLAKDSQELTLKALAFANEPLHFNGRRKLYEGSISVGIVELMPSGRTMDLSAPITFEVLGVAAKPNQPVVEKTAPPFQTVAIEADNPNEAINVRVRSLLNPTEESVVSLPVERLHLRASVSPETIQGWGLEKATVAVWAEKSSAAGYGVQLRSRLGRLEPPSLTLDPEARGVSSVRSVSTGKDRLIVEGVNFEPATVEVEYVLPLRFILAALVGGLLGGLPGSGGRTRKVLHALVYGILVFGIFATGINLTGLALPQNAGEVVVFVVSAIGALMGPKPFLKAN